jgi:hypothetical protein
MVGEKKLSAWRIGDPRASKRAKRDVLRIGERLKVSREEDA